MIPKTLVVGAKGYVGSHFLAYYRQFYPDLMGTHHTAASGFIQVDLKQLNPIDGSGYEYVLLAGGICDPVRCERDPEESYFINVTQTLQCAQDLFKQSVIPIFFSSEYALAEGNQYGREKRELEKRAWELFKEHCLIIRPTKIYGTTKGDATLFDQMAKVLSENQRLHSAVDQMLSPIHIDDLIKEVVDLQVSKATGIFNLTGSESLSRYDAACILANLLGKSKNLVTPISLDDITDGVKRPKGTLRPLSQRGQSLKQNLRTIARNYAE